MIFIVKIMDIQLLLLVQARFMLQTKMVIVQTRFLVAYMTEKAFPSHLQKEDTTLIAVATDVCISTMGLLGFLQRRIFLMAHRGYWQRQTYIVEDGKKLPHKI